MPSGPTLQQVNVRLDAELKRSAEEVLTLMDSSATELIRSAYQKVARGAKDYAEAMEVLKGDKGVDEQGESPLEQGWRVAEDFYRTISADPTFRELDERSWGEVYEEAATAHFEEKGVLL